MRVLLTGVAGFIGSHLAERLLKGRHEIIGIDNFDPLYPRNGKQWNLRDARKMGRLDLYEINVADAGQVDKLFRSVRIDAIVHLAARCGAVDSMHSPVLHDRTNALGTLNLLEAARRNGPKRFLLASCASVYGDLGGPAKESQAGLLPVSAHGVSKLAAERYARVYHELFGIRTTILRFFTIYGPRQRPDMAIVRFARGILKGESVDLYEGGGTSRDYVFVSDAVDAIVRALEKEESFGIYNVGSGQEITTKDVLAEVEGYYGQKVKARRVALPSGVPRRVVADTTAARKGLGWSAVTPLGEGIRQYFDWFMKSRPTLRMVMR